VTARVLPLGSVVLLVGIVVWRSWWQRRRYGSPGVLLFRSARWQEKLRDGLVVVLVLLLIGQAVVAAARPQALASRYAFDQSAAELTRVIGVVLSLGGAILLVAAQLDLGAAWRIGIQEGARPGLVTAGVYRFCRNPIFSAMLVMLTGYTLLLPTRLSLALLVSAFAGMRAQVLTEEAYLSRAYGDAYREYAGRVGRFVPRIGRLR